MTKKSKIEFWFWLITIFLLLIIGGGWFIQSLVNRYRNKKQMEGWNSPSTGECFIKTSLYPTEKKQVVIHLNQVYLLNKFGCEKFFGNYSPDNDYAYLDISFKSMIETCCHEIAHYIQFAKCGKSSCESDLGLVRYDPFLAQEHKEIRREIFQLIKKDWEQWEKKWREI